MRIEIGKKVLQKNDQLAEELRQQFKGSGLLTFNLISSPGSGKTTLLEKTLPKLSRPSVVIEGDVSTQRDADRIREIGIPAVQIETQGGCHLDAAMVQGALKELSLPAGGFLFIENVGNLVCPTAYDLGEDAKVVLLSVPEGDDKPLKYPGIFSGARAAVLNKLDLLPYTDFNVEKFQNEAWSINPQLKIFMLSCKTESGIAEWVSWLEELRNNGEA